MKDLIEALQILLKYGNPHTSTQVRVQVAFDKKG
jgi:hypothetical protein